MADDDFGRSLDESGRELECSRYEDSSGIVWKRKKYGAALFLNQVPEGIDREREVLADRDSEMQ